MTEDEKPRRTDEHSQPTELHEFELDNVAGGTRGGGKKQPPPLGGVTPAVVWNTDEPPITFWPPKKHLP